MVKVIYSYRLLCDSHFLEWLAKQPERRQILNRLMYIKASSSDHRKKHNLILDSEVKKCRANPGIGSKYLGGAFKNEENPKFLAVHPDDISKNIIFAIYLTNSKPYSCILLTAPDKKEGYESNAHLNPITRVKIKSGDDAKLIIDNFYRAFHNAREIERSGI